MTQRVLKITMDTIPDGAEGVVDNVTTIPATGGTTTVAVLYDPATINMHQFQMAFEAFLQFVQQDCNSSYATSANTRPVGAAA